MNTQDFLNDIRFALNVGAPAWGFHTPYRTGTINGETEALEDLALLVKLDKQAAEAFGPLGTIGNLTIYHRHLTGNHHIARLTTAQLEDHRGCEFDTDCHAGRIDTALETIAGIAVDLQRATGFGDLDRIEQGAFQ